MAHPSFPGFDEPSLLACFLEGRDASSLETRRRAHLAWSVLCARHIERMRAWIVLHRRRSDHRVRAGDFDERVLRQAVERALAAGSEFEGSSLRDFRTLLRETARRTCAEAMARGL